MPLCAGHWDEPNISSLSEYIVEENIQNQTQQHYTAITFYPDDDTNRTKYGTFRLYKDLSKLRESIKKKHQSKPNKR